MYLSDWNQFSKNQKSLPVLYLIIITFSSCPNRSKFFWLYAKTISLKSFFVPLSITVCYVRYDWNSYRINFIRVTDITHLSIIQFSLFLFWHTVTGLQWGTQVFLQILGFCFRTNLPPLIDHFHICYECVYAHSFQLTFRFLLVIFNFIGPLHLDLALKFKFLV